MNRRPVAEKGVTMVEFALIVGIVFMVIFGIIDLARYVAVKNLLDAGADQAVMLAATIPGLEENAGTDAYEEAEAAIIAKAKALPLSSFVQELGGSGLTYFTAAPELTIPTPLTDANGVPIETAEDALEDRPIQVTMRAQVRPLLWFLPPLPVVGRAAAYREPTHRLTMPLELDCRGNPAGSPDFYADCPCEADQYWDRQARACYCYIPHPGSLPPCSCASPDYVPDATGRSCSCNSGPCADPLAARNPTTCACECVSPYVLRANGLCGCSQLNYIVQNNVCVCDPQAANNCHGGAYYRASDCSCQCYAYKNQVPDGANGCKCTDPKKVVDPQTLYCVCPSTPCANPAQQRNMTTCDCDCSHISADIRSNCGTYGGSWNDTTCSCDNACGGGGDVTWNPENGSCNCTDPAKIFSQSWWNNPFSCNCGEATDWWGTCYCDSGKHPERGVCVCDNLGDWNCEWSSNWKKAINPTSCQCECRPLW